MNLWIASTSHLRQRRNEPSVSPIWKKSCIESQDALASPAALRWALSFGQKWNVTSMSSTHSTRQNGRTFHEMDELLLVDIDAPLINTVRCIPRRSNSDGTIEKINDQRTPSDLNRRNLRKPGIPRGRRTQGKAFRRFIANDSLTNECVPKCMLTHKLHTCIDHFAFAWRIVQGTGEEVTSR